MNLQSGIEDIYSLLTAQREIPLLRHLSLINFHAELFLSYLLTREKFPMERIKFYE